MRMTVLAVLGLAVCFAVCFTGCASSAEKKEIVSAEQDKLDRFRRVAEIAALNGTYLYLEKNPGQRTKFLAAADVLKRLGEEGNGDPTVLISALQMLPIEDLKVGQTAILIANAQLLLEELKGQPVAIDTPPRVRAFTQGLSSGISRALELLVPPN